jgi:nucleotide-binding universal stress UspA family protein
MKAIASPPPPRASVRAPELEHEPGQAKAPIVAAVDASAASRSVIDSALGLAAELETPLVFVYVRRGPSSSLGAPVYQRRLTNAMARASGILDRALAAAARAGVDAEGEILEGRPRKRILEFASDRGARLIVVGSRHHKFGSSVSDAICLGADRPVVVARQTRSRLREQPA